MEAWPALTEAVKTGIVAMVRATVGSSQQATRGKE
jgi:hypothetical protein